MRIVTLILSVLMLLAALQLCSKIANAQEFDTLPQKFVIAADKKIPFDPKHFNLSLNLGAICVAHYQELAQPVNQARVMVSMWSFIHASSAVGHETQVLQLFIEGIPKWREKLVNEEFTGQPLTDAIVVCEGMVNQWADQETFDASFSKMIDDFEARNVQLPDPVDGHEE